MLRIGALRGSGRKRTAGNSPRCARLRHPAVFFSFGLHCSALRPRGPNTDKLAVARARSRLLCRTTLWPNPTRTESRADCWVGGPVGFRFWLGVCIQARCTATETRSGDGCPAHCAGAYSMSEDRQSDPSSVRIPSPLRVGVHRRSRRCARVSFSFAYFLLDKQKKVSRTAVRNQRSHELVSAPTPEVRAPGTLTPRPPRIAPEASTDKTTHKRSCPSNARPHRHRDHRPKAWPDHPPGHRARPADPP